ncbi:hypothetical protein EVAR_2596_1 [Eumeta japonica]|uniref:Uncharacterized protein n=1 Tax=Eumeta variegata TaxID=151549 RepID=A0A4C1SLX4_EUMVA|nr:hypothetical protein EVAR_2596_1 [Eumeta japonica]
MSCDTECPPKEEEEQEEEQEEEEEQQCPRTPVLTLTNASWGANKTSKSNGLMCSSRHRASNLILAILPRSEPNPVPSGLKSVRSPTEPLPLLPVHEPIAYIRVETIKFPLSFITSS